MNRVLLFLFVFLFANCSQPNEVEQHNFMMKGKGGLLTTRFQSLEELKAIVSIEYSKDRKSWVRLTHKSNGQLVESILKKGVSEKDILKTRDQGFFQKAKLGLRTPYFVSNRMEMLKSFILSRRRDNKFRAGDIAFYDLAVLMADHINQDDLKNIPPDDLSNKGYINTFNHITAQALMTSIFSEDLADFIADIHERKNMPELISGKFTDEQLSDPKNGAVDNYIDMINNEWGQELGKLLKKKYSIDQSTKWTPQLLSDFLNDNQKYYSRVFEIGFQPVRPHDKKIIRFADKINFVLNDVSGLR